MTPPVSPLLPLIAASVLTRVYLAYATPEFHCLLDGDLFLPKSWSEDRGRCRAAGIPDDVEHRPKWEIALELHERAQANGVTFGWIGFDEGYGRIPEFLEQLSTREQLYVGDYPHWVTGWLVPAETTARPYQSSKGGRPRSTPRVKTGSMPARTLKHHLSYAAALQQQPWVRYHVKDGEKGPLIWEVKHVLWYPKA